MAHAYPLMIDVTDRPIVVVGGGAVAARKVAGLLAAGATRIKVVSPSFDITMPEAVERITAEFEAGHLVGATLVFAATDFPSVNSAVVVAARAQGALVNRADGDAVDPGDFITPALFRDGPMTLMVSTASPALSAAVRDELKSKLDPRWSILAQTMETIRPAILAADLSTEERKAIFRELATSHGAALANEGFAVLVSWIQHRIGKRLNL